MVIVIHQTANTGNALSYNEKKVKEGVATFFHSCNTKSVNPFMYDEKHRLKNLLDIEKMNPRTKNKCLHISFNPSTDDYLKLGDEHIRQEIDNMMVHMGTPANLILYINTKIWSGYTFMLFLHGLTGKPERKSKTIMKDKKCNGLSKTLKKNIS